MTDENPQPVQDEVPQDSAPVDGTVSTNNPHPVDEDPEDHIGDEKPDPWTDQEFGWKAEYKDDEPRPADEPVEQKPEDNA